MKNLLVIGACATCFILGTLFPLRTTHAQPPPAKTTYYNLSFLKALPGQHPIKIEREQWAQIHRDLVKSGIIKSWSVIEPLYSGAHSFDYMTLIAFTDFAAFNKADYAPLFKKHWGDKWQTVLEQTTASRDMVGNEIWYTTVDVGSDTNSR